MGCCFLDEVMQDFDFFLTFILFLSLSGLPQSWALLACCLGEPNYHIDCELSFPEVHVATESQGLHPNILGGTESCQQTRECGRKQTLAQVSH